MTKRKKTWVVYGGSAQYKMTTYYQIQLDYINKRGPPAYFTKFYPDGISLTGIPKNMRYKKKYERLEDVVVRPWINVNVSGRVVVGTGINRLTFKKDTTCYTKDSDGEPDSDGDWV